MATISENLQIIADSTAAIKQAIINKGGDVTGDITTWADAISGLSGGGNGDSGSNEEISFVGTMSSQATSVNYVGTLYAPENINRAYLVMMDYYLTLRTSFIYINNSVTPVNMSLNYDEPLGGTETPILILMYSLPEDIYGRWRVQIVPFTQQSGGNPN